MKKAVHINTRRILWKVLAEKVIECAWSMTLFLSNGRDFRNNNNTNNNNNKLQEFSIKLYEI